MTEKYNLEEGMAIMKEQMPDVMSAFGPLMEKVTQDGLLSAKIKRLMMVAVSVTQRCSHCIRAHVKAAVELGASRAEILEATGVAILMAGGPAVAQVSTVVLEALEESGV
ncbi:alkylhydroperoxidase AhpD family core domain protein [delta proteobacterium NaphS2]|nr:alkylhydroperoxidase AhpD family core domain protein [delta proteobacterium NaphS2]